MIPGKDGHLPIPACEDDGGPTELGRLLEEALRCLESTDLYGANAAVKRAHAEAASPGVAAPGDHETGKKSEDRG